jgi:uncharacterized protein (DUF983 family)
MTISIASPAVIVLVAVAAILAGVARYIGGKAKLPDWASLTVALFVFGIVLQVAHF